MKINVLSALTMLCCAMTSIANANSLEDQAWTKENLSIPKESQPLKYSVFAEYSAQKAQFGRNIRADLEGESIGFSTAPQKSGFSVKVEHFKADEIKADYYGGDINWQLNLLNTNELYALTTVGLGYGHATSDMFDSTSFVTLPIKFEVGLNLTKNVALYGGVGYKWNLDTSTDDKVLCKDGYLGNDRGSKSCGSHGGVNRYYKLNFATSFHGLTYNTGLRYSF